MTGAALAPGLHALLSEGSFCDTVLKAGDQTFRAHQVVLAAQQTPLRDRILDRGATTGEQPEIVSSVTVPQHREFELEGITRPEDVNALLDFAYGKGSVSSFDNVAAGLRALRQEGRLCDAVVKAGGKTFPIHQVVLAAASRPLRDFITTTVADHTGGAAPAPEQQQLVPEPVEIELQSVTCGEALGIVFDHIYGSLESYRPTTSAVSKEVFSMCVAFDLPILRGLADKWKSEQAQGSRHGVAKQAPVERREEPPKEPVQEKKDKAILAPAKKGEEENAEEAEAEHDAGSVEEESTPAAIPKKAPPLPEPKAADFERSMKALQKWSFDNWRDAPPMPPKQVAQAGLKKHEIKLLDHLRQAFEQRPVWLSGPLLERIFNAAPNIFDLDTVERLFPRVAYQWNDGPWLNTFTRLGWDPRKEAGANKFQVLEFRDPALKGTSTKKIGDKKVEFQFRQPPCLPRQCYQLLDIKDEEFAAVLSIAEVEEECSKKFGWLQDWVLQACQERLVTLSQELRAKERIADTPRPSKTRSDVAPAGWQQKRRRIS